MKSKLLAERERATTVESRPNRESPDYFGAVIAILLFWQLFAFTDDQELANVYYQSGLGLQKQNNYAQAMEKFTAALSYRRDFPEALLRLGECYERINDQPKALRNYRACLKALLRKGNRTKDEEDALAQVTKYIDKLDVNSRQLAKIKNSYTANVMAIANDCYNKRLPRFTRRLVYGLLRVNPESRSVQELLAKIDKIPLGADRPDDNKPDKTDPEKPSDQKRIKLFNGQAISGWEVAGDHQGLQKWRVESSCLAGGSNMQNLQCFLIWKGKIPENYKLTLSYSAERIYVSQSTHLGIVYGGQGGSYDMTQISAYGPTGSGRVEFVRQDGKGKLKINGRMVNDNIILSGSAVIGLMTKNSHIYFSNIFLQELK